MRADIGIASATDEAALEYGHATLIDFRWTVLTNGLRDHVE